MQFLQGEIIKIIFIFVCFFWTHHPTDECNGVFKVLLPHTFERHAGCKTKQPNNYIYFENGKSANQVVEELRSTSGNQLFETIHTVTGSPINEKAFNIWKGEKLFSSCGIFLNFLLLDW